MGKKYNVMSGTQVKHVNSNQWEDRVISGNEWTRGAIFKSVTHPPPKTNVSSLSGS